MQDMIVSRISWCGLLFGLWLAATLSVTPAAATNVLDDLRASGALGERFDGFLEVRDTMVPSAGETAKRVNDERRKIYMRRAEQDGVDLAQIGLVYARVIIEQAPLGTWFQNRDGGWIRKQQ